MQCYVADEGVFAAFDVQGDLLGEVCYDEILLENPCAMAVHKNKFYMCVIDSCFDALHQWLLIINFIANVRHAFSSALHGWWGVWLPKGVESPLSLH